MKVNSMYPVIVSDNPEKTMQFYESLGFKKKHDLITGMGSHVYIIANGDYEIELMESVNDGPWTYKAGLYGFRLNVDDLDAAVETIKQNGGTVLTEPLETPYATVVAVQDVDGNYLTIMKHKRK